MLLKKREVTAKSKRTFKDQVFFWKGTAVMTTKQVANSYGCGESDISRNFSKNKERFRVKDDYFRLTGENVKEFIKENNWNDEGIGVSNNVNILYLWTFCGAAKFCVVLTTPKAWEVWDKATENFDLFGLMAKGEKLCKSKEFKNSLYTILFKNGMIKVGKSYKPENRVSCHIDNAKSFGVGVEKYKIMRNPVIKELDLINFCFENGTLHHGNEYFTDLDFQMVVDFMCQSEV